MAPADLRPYLRPDEQLLWRGQPDPAVVFAPSDVFLVPFTLLWCGFAVFWETTVLSSGGPIFFRLWGIPFVLVGLYMVFGRFVAKRRRKDQTVYAVTTQRAIVLVGGRSLTDAPLKQQGINVERARDGRHASVVIGPTGRAWGNRRSFPNNGVDVLGRGGAFVPFGFYDVAYPDAMLHAIEQARTT